MTTPDQSRAKLQRLIAEAGDAIAAAALEAAQPDGPAVPEGREPAAAQDPQQVEVSDAAVHDLTASLGMIAMEAVTSIRTRPDEALRHMHSEARQAIMEWVNALPLPTTTPAKQEGA